MECVPSLEEAILEILGENPNLTNQEIRKRLHRSKSHGGVTKYNINTTLHTLLSKGVLLYQVVGINKCWSIVQNLPAKVEKVKEDEEEYESVLKRVKEKASIWKLRNSTSVYPTRPDRIANFIENSALKGLSPELYVKLSLEISVNGWD